MTTITFLVCLMYLWCSHHSWSVSYLLCFTTAYLLGYTFNNWLTHLLRHTVIILSVISRLCHMWHHVHLSVPAGLRSAPVAHPWHALMPCCGRFNVLSGLLLPCCSMKRGRASALRRSTIRHPAVTVALLPPPPHDCHGHYSFGTNAAHSSERCLIMCYETGISPSHFHLTQIFAGFIFQWFPFSLRLLVFLGGILLHIFPLNVRHQLLSWPMCLPYHTFIGWPAKSIPPSFSSSTNY